MIIASDWHSLLAEFIPPNAKWECGLSHLPRPQLLAIPECNEWPEDDDI
jgi:hypothetical protein